MKDTLIELFTVIYHLMTGFTVILAYNCHGRLPIVIDRVIITDISYAYIPTLERSWEDNKLTATFQAWNVFLMIDH